MKRSLVLSILMVLDGLMVVYLVGEVVQVLRPIVVLVVQSIATSLNSVLVVD